LFKLRNRNFFFLIVVHTDCFHFLISFTFNGSQNHLCRFTNPINQRDLSRPLAQLVPQSDKTAPAAFMFFNLLICIGLFNFVFHAINGTIWPNKPFVIFLTFGFEILGFLTTILYALSFSGVFTFIFEIFLLINHTTIFQLTLKPTNKVFSVLFFTINLCIS